MYVRIIAFHGDILNSYRPMLAYYRELLDAAVHVEAQEAILRENMASLQRQDGKAISNVVAYANATRRASGQSLQEMAVGMADPNLPLFLAKIWAAKRVAHAASEHLKAARKTTEGKASQAAVPMAV